MSARPRPGPGGPAWQRPHPAPPGPGVTPGRDPVPAQPGHGSLLTPPGLASGPEGHSACPGSRPSPLFPPRSGRRGRPRSRRAVSLGEVRVLPAPQARAPRRRDQVGTRSDLGVRGRPHPREGGGTGPGVPLGVRGDAGPDAPGTGQGYPAPSEGPAGREPAGRGVRALATSRCSSRASPASGSHARVSAPGSLPSRDRGKPFNWLLISSSALSFSGGVTAFHSAAFVFLLWLHSQGPAGSLLYQPRVLVGGLFAGNFQGQTRAVNVPFPGAGHVCL